MKIINCCRNCPLYNGSDKEMAVCTHPTAQKRGVYNNIVSRSHFKPEPIPKWCPIKKTGYTEIKRDKLDNIISTIKYIIKDNTEG